MNPTNCNCCLGVRVFIYPNRTVLWPCARDLPQLVLHAQDHSPDKSSTATNIIIFLFGVLFYRQVLDRSDSLQTSKHHSKAKRRAPACPRALCRIGRVV